MIDKNKTYTTKLGLKVKFYEWYEDRIHGAILHYDDVWSVECWDLEGGEALLSDIGENDLIEGKLKVMYLKSIRQILEEFPGVIFDERGFIRCPSWSQSINPAMLYKFGGKLPQSDGWAYIPEWIEELEEE